MIIGLHQRRCLIIFGSVALCLAGCQQGAFRAASLPPDFMAPTIASSQQLDLARLSNSAGGNDRITPGDLVQVTVVTGIREADEESNWKLQVSDRGVADVPLIGPVPIAGLNTPEASLAIRESGIQRGIYRNPRVTVQVVRRQTNTVTVMGAVESPGVHKLPMANTDLVAALAAAGGFKDEASTMVEVRLPSRGGPTSGPFAMASHPTGSAGHPTDSGANPPQVHRVDLARAAASGNASFPLPDGAVVMVGKEQTRAVYVMGLVNDPQQVVMPPDKDLRLLDALASAGGRTYQIADDVTVTRQHPRDGPSILIQASVRDAQQNSIENIRLAPGDVVKVEETAATFTVGLLRDFVRFGFSAAIPGT